MDFRVEQRDVMTTRDKATFTALVAIYIASVVYYATWWFQPQHIAVNWPDLGYLGFALDTLIFLSLSFVIWRGIIQNLYTHWIVSTMKTPVYVPPAPGQKVAMMTCFVPGKEPYGMLEKTLAAMTRVSYPHDTWVLDEGDDPTVKAMCSRLGVKHFSRKGIPEYNQPSGKFKARTKGGNHNAWADRHGDEYDLVAQMDVDFVPNSDFLERTLGYFRDPKVAFVGSPQIYGNQSESWIARGAAEQAFIFYGPMQKGLFGKGMQLLIGANHVYRTEAWRDIGGYSGHIVEDHLTGMRVYAKGWKSVYVPEILCVGEGPADMSSYISQQMRWSYGLIDILFRHTPRLVWKLNWTQKIGYVFLQFFYFFGVAQLLGVVLTTLYLTLGLTATTMQFGDWLTHAAPPFFINIFVFQWLQNFNIDPKTENGQGLKGIALMFAAWPIYALAFFAAVIGRRITYAVTPKGSAGQASINRPSLRAFVPHLVSAATSLVGLILFPLSGFGWPPLVFWAALNFATMIGVLTVTWHPVIVPAAIRSRLRPLGFPLGMATATTAIVLIASINIPALLDIAPVSTGADVTASTTNVGVQNVGEENVAVETERPVQARFLQPGSHRVAIGSLASSNDLQDVSKIAHYFATWRPQEVDGMIKSVYEAAKNDKVSMVSWEPRLSGDSDTSPTRPDKSMLQRIGNGEFDSYIADVASQLRDTKQPVILRFAHEMDLPDDGLHPWSLQPADVYVAAYQRIHQIFEQQQADNVIWMWSPGGQTAKGKLIALPYYPGDLYVDMVGVSVFIFWEWEEWDGLRTASHSYRSPKEAIEPAYDEIRRLGKPMVLAEVGVDLYPSKQSERKEWMLSMLDLVKQEQFSNIVAVVFYNTHHPLSNFAADWRLNETELALVTGVIKSDETFELASGLVNGEASLRTD